MTSNVAEIEHIDLTAVFTYRTMTYDIATTLTQKLSLVQFRRQCRTMSYDCRTTSSGVVESSDVVWHRASRHPALSYDVVRCVNTTLPSEHILRAFSVLGPRLWNSLHNRLLRHTSHNITSFEHSLKTFFSHSTSAYSSLGALAMRYTTPRFYRAMHFSAKRGIAIACRLSVRLSVCLSVCP